MRLDYMTEKKEQRDRRVRWHAVCVAQRREQATDPERITAFLDSLPPEPHSGIAPTGYQYREYKNWRGIPKPRL